ncbi:DUF6233 domain-containing protein [Streptomyces sp. NPDC048606]|uniref:DUF6233 domain-containing protein n=1 Tax=Streptomyces sp. NPDC048606 TaxID=3154726 RepID=UPI0034150FBC
MGATVPDPWANPPAGTGVDPGPARWAPIMMLLPDGRQHLRVRLHERRRDDDTGRWLYLIGAPLWQYAGRGDVEAMEFRTWVTADQLRPIPGVDLSAVPTHRGDLDRPAAPTRWGWVLRPDPGGRTSTLHDHDCELAASAGPAAGSTAGPGGAELGLDGALDALLRPGTEACHHCDAAAALIPMIELGQGYP